MKKDDVRLFLPKRMQRIIHYALFMVALLHINMATACMFWRSSDADALKNHNIVFLGEYAGCFSKKGVSYVEYSVHKIWKGPIQSTFTSIVDDCTNDSAKSYMGIEFIIFANKVENSDHIDIPTATCSLNTRQINPLHRRYFMGFALPGIFDYQSVPEDLSELGVPIYVSVPKVREQ